MIWSTVTCHRSEALINSLTELKQLRVIARSTAFRYKSKDVDAQAVGRELNVFEGNHSTLKISQVGKGGLPARLSLISRSSSAGGRNQFLRLARPTRAVSWFSALLKKSRHQLQTLTPS